MIVNSLRTRCIACLILGISCSASVAAPADWQQVMEIKEPVGGTSYMISAKSYIDVANIHEDQGIRQLSHRLVRDQAMLSPGRVLIKEYRESLLVNCSKRSLALVRVGFVDPSGAEVGHRDVSEQFRQFEVPPPGSQKATLINAACAAKVATQSASSEMKIQKAP